MEEFLLKAIAGGVGTGGVLAGVIYFIGRRLLRLEEAFDRLTKMELIRLIASPHVGSELKEVAASLIKDVEVAETRRRKP